MPSSKPAKGKMSVAPTKKNINAMPPHTTEILDINIILLTPMSELFGFKDTRNFWSFNF